MFSINLANLALPIAVLTSILVYCIAIMLMPKRMFSEQSKRVREALKRIETEQRGNRFAETVEVEDPIETMLKNPLVRAFALIPGANRMLPLLHSAGLAESVDKFFLGAIAVFMIIVVLCGEIGVHSSLLVAVAATPVLLYLYLKGRIAKQRKHSLDVFPEALDMIVRSVKAGYPINTALGIVAENVPAPLNGEFKRLLYEMSMGTTLTEACSRFANRMDDPDVRFFAVVVGIQQESGGNLSEILGNISNVIRQRRQLKMKIRALSSEGRATAWIIGGLVVLLTVTIHVIAPHHLDPLWVTSAGHKTLITIGSLMVLGVFLIRKIIDVEV